MDASWTLLWPLDSWAIRWGDDQGVGGVRLSALIY